MFIDYYLLARIFHSCNIYTGIEFEISFGKITNVSGINENSKVKGVLYKYKTKYKLDMQ